MTRASSKYQLIQSDTVQETGEDTEVKRSWHSISGKYKIVNEMFVIEGTRMNEIRDLIIGIDIGKRIHTDLLL